ncbi:MAG TPA: hypothetical protein DD490_32895, partial [Acidobacteria bacterium]|nr:hypothetical protein [Acidobacteriota bacterium]
ELIGRGGSVLPDPADDSAVYAWVERALQEAGTLPERGHENVLRGLIEVFLVQFEMQSHYRPSGPLGVPVTLLHAAEGGMAGDRLQEVLAVYARVVEAVRPVAVPGGHFSMLSGANAAQLAETLLEVIP